MVVKTESVHIPENFYNVMMSWDQQKGWPVRNKGLKVCIAIMFLDEKIKEMSDSERNKFHNDMIRRVNNWIKAKLIDENARNISKKGK